MVPAQQSVRFARMIGRGRGAGVGCVMIRGNGEEIG